MGVFSAVACKEEYGTATENAGLKDGVSASVVLRCAYADRLALMDDLLGFPRVWPRSGYTLPPSAISCACKPDLTKYTQSSQEIVYEEALVTVNYSTEVQDLVSESLEPTQEFITLDYRRFCWGSPNGPNLIEGEAPGKLIRGLNIVRTLYKKTTVPAAVLATTGVNNVAYSSNLLGLTFPSETLLYEPGNLSRTFTTLGTEGFTVTVKFSYRQHGWNKFWRADTQQWTRIYLRGGAQYNSYPLVDYSSLLA